MSTQNESDTAPPPANPVAPTPPAPNVAGQPATVSLSHADLLVIANTIVPLVLAQLPGQTPAPATAPPAAPGTFPYPPGGPHPGAPGPFVGPLTGNPAASASPSLLAQFPEVEEAVIILVVTHALKPSDLYKLDAKYRDKADRGTLEFENGSVQVRTDTSTRDYPTPQSIEAPLTVYIRILIAHAIPTGQVAEVALATLAYLESFLLLRTEYEWSAVLQYHMAFFARRWHEMAQGDYLGWKQMDQQLQGDHLLGYRKARPAAGSSQASGSSRWVEVARNTEVCKLFNSGLCTTGAVPCRNGRIHKCSQCGNGQHSANNCTTGTRA